MNTRDTLSRFHHLRRMVASLDRLVGSVLGEITPYHRNISEVSLAADLASLLSESGEKLIHTQIDELRQKYLRERPKSRGVRPGRIFAQIYATQEELLRTWAEGAVPGKPPRKLRSGLRALEDAFEHYLREPSASGVLHLFQIGRDLSAALQISQDLIDALTATIGSEPSVPEGQQVLDLFLADAVGIPEIRRKLGALEQLYSITARTLDVSVTEFPLTITRLEVGSLWVKLFGETRVVSMITHFIEATAAFGYRNWTNEGRISAIPKKIEAVDAVLDLSKRLEAAGFDTDGLRDEVQRASIQIADQLNSLLAGERGVELNGRSLAPATGGDKTIDAPRAPLMLEAGTGSPEGEISEVNLADEE